jgi:hypothetical protein
MEDTLERRLEALAQRIGRSVSLREQAPVAEEEHEARTPEPTAEVSAGAGRISFWEPVPVETKTPAMDRAEQVLDYSTFKVDEPIDGEVAFSPWNLVVAYPSRYIGKTNKPLVRVPRAEHGELC